MATERELARPLLPAIQPVFAEPIQRARAPQLLELVDGLSLVPRRFRLDPPPDLVDDPAATAVEHSLAAADAPARAPAAVEGLDRGTSGQAQRPLGPKLEDGIAAPEHPIGARRCLRVEDDLAGRNRTGGTNRRSLERRRCWRGRGCGRGRGRHACGSHPHPRSKRRRARARVWLRDRDRRARGRGGRMDGGVRRPYPDTRLACWIHIGAIGDDDLSASSRRSSINCTSDRTLRISEVTASYRSFATASWVGQKYCIFSSSDMTTLASESSTRPANRRYSLPLKRGSFYSG